MATATAGIASERIAGSFRDPSGYVFRRGDRLFRAVDGPSYSLLNDLQTSGLLRDLMTEKAVVPTRFVDDPAERQALASDHAGYDQFLEHDVIAPLTWPYEWSVSMLADAGLHTLDLQTRLLAAGCSLKDASAYNVQFVHGRPTFIDLTSVEKPARLDVWFALGQFQRMFTFPLLLCRHHGWDLRSYFLANLDGRDVEQVARGLGWFQLMRPRMLLDVTLPLLLGRQANKSSASGRSALEKPNRDPGPQLLNLQRLRAKVRRLAEGYRPSGTWSYYTQTCTYDTQADSAKKSLVGEFLKAERPATVLDAGCNTGDYSYLAAECGANVLAADGDHDAIELLYRRLKKQPATINPLVLDLSNPSPAIGFRNAERSAFLERLQVDCVLALALLHHLLVTANLSLPAIRDYLADLTSRDLVLEFVPPDDVMFQQLLKFRHNLFADLTLDSCKAVLAKRFELLAERPVPGSPRTLLFLRKKP